MVTITPKPVKAEAIQFNGKNVDEIKQFAGDGFVKHEKNQFENFIMIKAGGDGIYPGREYPAFVGDWILRKPMLDMNDREIYLYYIMNDKKVRFYYDFPAIELIN